MFGFGKKKKTHFTSRVLMSRHVLDQVLIDKVRSKGLMLITFFPATRNALAQLLNDASLEEMIVPAEKIMHENAASRIHAFLMTGGTQVALAERHPLSTHEIQVADKLEQSGIPLPILAYTSLDDALMMRAGGERIKSLMLSMGMKEDEVIEHAMIESSIVKFQEKIAGKISVESNAQSQEEWFRKNVITG